MYTIIFTILIIAGVGMLFFPKLFIDFLTHWNAGWFAKDEYKTFPSSSTESTAIHLLIRLIGVLITTIGIIGIL